VARTTVKQAQPAALQFDAEQVRRYYDDNTRLFLSLGQGTEGTIHRAVWGPGVQNRAEAMAYVDGLLLQQLRSISDAGRGEPLRVADLGSGVCASLCRLARDIALLGTGITISPAQVALAEQRIAASGLSGSVRCVQGDFCNLQQELPPVDLAFAIESFVHATSGEAFFQTCSRLVRPGGYLIVCDDLLAAGALRNEPRAGKWIRRFGRGWVASNLLGEEEAQALAKRAGFSHRRTLDLSPYLEIRRPRDYLMALLIRSLGWLPIKGSYWSMLYGGHALQVCLERGWIKHLFVVWQKDSS
jgi:SAM-dependent methyltransferase